MPYTEDLIGHSSATEVTTCTPNCTLPPVGITTESIITIDTITTNTTGVIPQHLMDPDARARGLIQVESKKATKSWRRVIDTAEDVWVRVGPSGISVYDGASMTRVMNDDVDGECDFMGDEVLEPLEDAIDGEDDLGLARVEEDENLGLERMEEDEEEVKVKDGTKNVGEGVDCGLRENKRAGLMKRIRNYMKKFRSDCAR